MDLVDLNFLNLSKNATITCRDPCGSRGSKWIEAEDPLQVEQVEILVDLVDLNMFFHESFKYLLCRDPCGSRGSKSYLLATILGK